MRFVSSFILATIMAFIFAGTSEGQEQGGGIPTNASFSSPEIGEDRSCRYQGKTESALKQISFEKNSTSERALFSYFTRPQKKDSSTKNSAKTKESQSLSCSKIDLTGFIDAQLVDVQGCSQKKMCLVRIDAVINDLDDIRCAGNPRRLQFVRLRKHRVLRSPEGFLSSGELSVLFDYPSATAMEPHRVQISEDRPASQNSIMEVAEDEDETPSNFSRLLLKSNSEGQFSALSAGPGSFDLDNIKEQLNRSRSQKKMTSILPKVGIEFQIYQQICKDQKERLILSQIQEAKKAKSAPMRADNVLDFGL